MIKKNHKQVSRSRTQDFLRVKDVRRLDSAGQAGEGAQGEAGQGRGPAHHPIHQAIRSQVRCQPAPLLQIPAGSGDTGTGTRIYDVSTSKGRL